MAGSDDRWSSPHATQGSGSFKARFPSLGCQQIADFMNLEVTPHILDRVEFRRASRKAFHDDALAGGGDVMLGQQAAMDRGAIPQHQNFAGDVPLQVLEKLNDLRAFDAALMDLKVKSPQGQTANNRKAFPVERLVQRRSLPARRPGADSRRACAQPAFIYENDGSSLSAGLFLNQAIPLAASGGWLSRLAPPPGAPVSGN